MKSKEVKKSSEQVRGFFGCTDGIFHCPVPLHSRLRRESIASFPIPLVLLTSHQILFIGRSRRLQDKRQAVFHKKCGKLRLNYPYFPLSFPHFNVKRVVMWET